MKALAWQQFFVEQRDRHGKVIFSVAELANVARTSLHNVNTELGRLVQRGLIRRYAQGRYGLPDLPETEAIISGVDPSAYITGHYALFLNRIVTQVATRIDCFTRRRHHPQKACATESGKVNFVTVPPAIYDRPSGRTPAEQALCDFCWLTLRNGMQPQSLVTFRNLRNLKPRTLRGYLKHYPEAVQRAVEQIVSGEPYARVG